MKEAMQKAAVLIEAMPYLQRFAGMEVVIKFGGSTMETPEIIDDILEDVVFMATVGIKPILVHGGGKRISEAMDRSGLEPEFSFGHRVTCKDSLKIVVDVLTEINAELVQGAGRHGGSAVSGFSGGESAIKVKKKLTGVGGENGPEGRDIGYVGEVVSVNKARLRELRESEDILIVPPLGQDPYGQLYNVNADSAAAAIAATLQAEKIVFLSDVHGIMTRPGDDSSFLSSINREEVDHLISKGVISGGMLPKVEGCLKSIEAGVRKAHIIDGSLEHSLLLEIFTDAGVGTQIVG